MFDKELEEYKNQSKWKGKIFMKDEEICFKDGAELGYNKANEWHKVSDKLPEMDAFVYLWKKGKDFPVVACRHFPYGKKEWVWNCEWGSGYTMSQLKGKDYLWKEMELPKEITE